MLSDPRVVIEDVFRREHRRVMAAFAHRKADLHALSQPELSDPANAEEGDSEMRDNFPDERLKLMFTCCHPSLSLEAQIALTLRTLGGLSTAEIARAFLVPIPLPRGDTALSNLD